MQIEGQPGFYEVWDVAPGAESPDGSAVCAAGRSGRHQLEPESRKMTAGRLGQKHKQPATHRLGGIYDEGGGGTHTQRRERKALVVWM